MAELDVEVARWLVSDDGLAAVDRTTAEFAEGFDDLAIASRLRTSVPDSRRGSAVLAAAKARRRAQDRWIHADVLLFTRESLEQASDPEVSRWRAMRFAGRRVWDLGAGCGGDTIALAGAGATVTAVELDPARSVLLAHNVEVLGLPVTIVRKDALQVDPPADAAIHADPARRRNGRRVRRLAEYVPAVPSLVDRHSAAGGMGIVVSPGLDTQDPGLPSDVEVEFIQLGRDLVEAVLWSGSLRTRDATATATLLPEGRQRSRHGDRPAKLPVEAVGTHLIEVAPAAVRARLHDDIGGEVGAHRIAMHRALLSSAGEPPPSPWYRVRAVVAVHPARPKLVRAWLRRHDLGPVEIVLHGAEGDPDRWWREFGRPPRGPGGIRVEVTRLDERTVVIVTDDATHR